MSLKLGVPSKGRLQAATFDWFKDHNITLKRTGSDREYTGRVEGVGDVDLVLLSAGEIPNELAAGRIHLGVTGQDLVAEKLPPETQKLEQLIEMGFGHADVVIAVPKVWVDVSTLADLDAVAAQFRRNHGYRLRIATKYHNIIRRALRDFGVADYQLVDSQGATEGTVKNLTAEAIADITSTGSTLDANHLKPLSDGPILRSQATVFLSRVAEWNDDARAAFSQISQKCGWEEPEL